LLRETMRPMTIAQRQRPSSAPRRRSLLFVLGFGILLGLAPAGAQTPPPVPPDNPAAPSTQPPPGETGAPEGPQRELVPPATDPGETPSGALAFFMASRDYRTIPELKSILTPQPKAAHAPPAPKSTRP